jgi:hypothetical protein
VPREGQGARRRPAPGVAGDDAARPDGPRHRDGGDPARGAARGAGPGHRRRDRRAGARFDSLQFLYGGEARESSGVAKHRIGLEGERPDWARAFDRFDTDFGAGSKLGGPIDRWMVSTDLHFEPPQVIAYRAWAGVRAQPAGTVALAGTHSALLRGFASAALGHDVGEPANLEHVDVEIDGARATVTFRGERADVEVPTEVPPWLDPAYLDAGERAAHRW